MSVTSTPRRRPVPAMLAFLGLACGCATLGRLTFTEPAVELTSVQLTGLGLLGGSFDLILDVYNPNAFSIRTGRIETAIELAQTPFGSASTRGSVEMPAREHTVVEIPLTFTWLGVGAGARSLLAVGSVPYQLQGDMILTSPIGEHPVRLQLGGNVSIADIAR